MFYVLNVFLIIGAKIRWESLRSQYRKYLRTREPKLKDKSGLAAVRISKWRLYDQMAFLRKFINNDRPQSSSITDDEISNENVRDTDTVKEELEKTSIRQDNDIEETEVNNEYVNTFTNNIPSIKKRNNNKANATVQQENVSSTLMKYILQKKEECGVHPIDKFFSLMATTVKNFSAADQHSVKTKVFALVSEIEEKYLTIPPSPVLQASS